MIDTGPMGGAKGLAFVLCVVLSACGLASAERQEVGQQVDEAPVVPAAAGGGVTDVDDASGFQPLFGRNTRDGWEQCGPGGFVLTNGVATSYGGMGLWWCSARTYTNFVLRGEWKMEAADSDTGVFVRFAHPGDDPWNAVRTGHELEIGDDPDGKDPAWRTGAVYPFSPPALVPTQPVGQWNSFEFAAIDQTYIVRINGEMVNVWTDPERRSASGYIGLQNYAQGKGAQFRNVRVRELP
jgi:hypothetical protein